ncbi:MAG: hypothetical protein LC803_12205 [Acidobacteria bacterium]|nr:hypothetical protein [Acidobacteriota bacterium]
MSREELLAWGGIILGLPGFLAYFVSPYAGVAALCLALLAVFIWYQRQGNLSEFTVLEIEKTLTINTRDGSRATLQRSQTARSNHKGITEFWCRNISSDGSITNIRIDGDPPHIQKTEAGDIQVCKRFQPALSKGQKFNTVLTYDLLDSFSNPSEGLIHVVEAPTKRLRLIVILPHGKPARNVRASLRYGGNPHMNLPTPHASNNGLRMEMTVNKPVLGAEYCIDWDW